MGSATEKLQALLEYICALDSLPESWKWDPPIRESDLRVSIGGPPDHNGSNNVVRYWYRDSSNNVVSMDHNGSDGAALGGETSLHQLGQCCLPDGCDPTSLSVRVCSQAPQMAPCSM